MIVPISAREQDVGYLRAWTNPGSRDRAKEDAITFGRVS